MKKTVKLWELMVLAGLCLTACGSKDAVSESPETETLGLLAQSQEEASQSLEILSQPQSLDAVNAPEGVSFTVEVNDEELVESYQWQVVRAEILDDDGYFVDWDWDDLTGSSACTNTLIKPSTDTSDGMDGTTRYRCIITDKDGNEYITEECYYTVENYKKTANYISMGEMAIRAGETLDLSTTPFGTGTVSLNEAGDHAILKDVQFDNTNAIYDISYSSQGFVFCDYNTPVETFTLEVQGDCSIVNTMFDAAENTGGLAMRFNYFGGDSALRDIVITGDGCLYVKGGQVLIYYDDTDLEIDCDLKLDSFEDQYTDGIRGSGNVYIHDCDIDLVKLNGRLIFSSYAIAYLENCNISGNTYIPAIPGISFYYKNISGAAGVHVVNSDIDITTTACADWFGIDGISGVVGLYSDDFTDIENSDIDFKFLVNGTKEDQFVFNMVYVYAANSVNINESDLTIESNTKVIGNATGIKTDALEVDDSKLQIDLSETGNVYGLSVMGDLTVNNSEVLTNVESTDNAYGVMCYGIQMEGADPSIEANASDGVAFGVLLESGEEERSYEDDYVPTVIGDSLNIVSPENSTINVSSLHTSSYIYFETIYGEDHTKPAASVVLQ